MPLHTTTIIRIEGYPDMAHTFASLEIREQIDGHHTFSLALPGQKFGAGAGTGEWRGLMGKRITIEIAPLDDPARGRNQSEPKLFTGLIMGLQLSKAYGPSGHVVLTGGSPTLLLDDDPHTQSFSGAPLQRIVKSELGHYPVNLLRPEVDPVAKESQGYVVQYKETTWNFLRRLARTRGEWFYYNGENVIFGRRNPKTFKLTHDVDLDDFSLQMGIRPASMRLSGYDYSGDSIVQYDTEQPTGLNTFSQSAVDAGKSLFLRKGLAAPNWRLNGSAFRQMKTMAKRREDASVAGMVHMRGESHEPRLGVGDHISVQESVYGKEAYGEYMLTEVHHQCSSDGDYSNYFSSIPADAAAPPHYLDDHPVAETQSAVVVDNNDPEDLGRVQVQFRWQEYGRTPWLRTVTPSGGAGKGLYMIPEKGEEVMVGFEGDNPERPYVLGGTWNGGGSSGFGTPKNDVKAIRTRSGHTIELNDTSGGEFITIKDKNGNAIRMDTKNKSITINAPEDMTLNAKNMAMNIQENLKVNVGKSKTERISEDLNLEAKNSTTKILKQRMVRSGEKTEQQAGELIVHTSNGDMTLDGTGKITIQSKDRIDFGE